MKGPGPVLAAAAAVIAVAVPADAQTPPEALTWMVLNEINSAYFDRTEPFNRPPLVTRVPDGVIRPVDISHDGRTDWLLDYTESGLMYCGTGGCLRTLYVSDGDDYVMVFDEQSHDFRIGGRGGETVIDATVHHVFCSGEADLDCAFAWTWDAELKQLVERPNAAGVTLLTNDGGFEPIGNREEGVPIEDRVPAELSEVWHQSRLTCPSDDNDGFRVFRATFKSIPDLNGDGRRDWLVRKPDPCPRGPYEEVQASPFSVWLTEGEGGLREVWTSEPDHWAVVDIATTPARLISNPSCGVGTPCPNDRLRWDPVASDFVPAR